MRTKISKLLLAVGCTASLMLPTSCIEETFPTDRATADQISKSPKASEALLWAMPAFFNNHATIGSDRHWDWGYGSIMHIRDVMTQDMSIDDPVGYDHYNSWASNLYQGENYIYGQFIWNYYWKFVQTSNNMISVIDTEIATDDQLGYLGAGYAFRALAYLDMAQMFEFLPNDAVSGVNAAGNAVDSLTVPIVTEDMDESAARNNPRVKRAVMAEFILDALQNAEKYIVYLQPATKTLPHLDAVYGLYARYYMWLGDYENAKTYARLAIDNASVQPMSEEDCLSLTDGFNTIDAWMWGSQTVAEDAVVKTGIVNWTSWMCPETLFGYAGAGAMPTIDASLYHKISDTDFRKKMFKAPAGSALDGKTAYVYPAAAAGFPTYTSVKFRANDGDIEDHTTGAASAYPIMRVEEMYLIEAEAVGMSEGVAAGVALLNKFMQDHRDATFNFTTTDARTLQLQVLLQMRIEFWGEGTSVFPTAKRLKPGVMQNYEGTNAPADIFKINCAGIKPNWNLVIPYTEVENNVALEGKNNPNPTKAVTGPSTLGEYAPGNNASAAE